MSRTDERTVEHTARPDEILAKVLLSPDVDSDGFRMSLWSGFYTGPVFAEIERSFALYRDENNVLFSLANYGPLTAKSISDFLGRPKNSISRAVERLTRRNLIRGEVDPLDRRRVLLTISNEGIELHRRTMALFKARQEIMLRSLTPVERVALDRILAKLMEDAKSWIETF